MNAVTDVDGRLAKVYLSRVSRDASAIAADVSRVRSEESERILQSAAVALVHSACAEVLSDMGVNCPSGVTLRLQAGSPGEVQIVAVPGADPSPATPADPGEPVKETEDPKGAAPAAEA